MGRTSANAATSAACISRNRTPTTRVRSSQTWTARTSYKVLAGTSTIQCIPMAFSKIICWTVRASMFIARVTWTKEYSWMDPWLNDKDLKLRRYGSCHIHFDPQQFESMIFSYAQRSIRIIKQANYLTHIKEITRIFPLQLLHFWWSTFSFMTNVYVPMAILFFTFCIFEICHAI